MRTFAEDAVREARSHALEGGQALHVWFGSPDWPGAPAVFRREAAAGRPWAHLFDQDTVRLRATARALGVRVVYVHKEGTVWQHCDLCAGPLARAVAVAEATAPTVAGATLDSRWASGEAGDPMTAASAHTGLDRGATTPTAASGAAGGRSAHGSHQVAAVAVCPRLYDIHYLEGYSAIEDKPFRLQGTLTHLCLAYWYAQRMDQAARAGLVLPGLNSVRWPPQWFYERDLNTALAETARGHVDWQLWAKEALLHYLDEYRDDPIIPYGPEEEFWATVDEIDPLPPLSSWPAAQRPFVEPLYSVGPIRVTGRVDLLALGPANLAAIPGARVGDDESGYGHGGAGAAGSGYVGWIFDFKGRSGRFGKNRDKLEVWKDDGEFALDWQSLMNLHVIRAHFRRERLPWRVEGVVIQRFKREPPWHVDRHILSIPQEAYDLTPRRVRQAVLQETIVQQQKAAGLEPESNFWACIHRYGACDYRDACRATTREKRQAWLDLNCTREPPRKVGPAEPAGPGSGSAAGTGAGSGLGAGVPGTGAPRMGAPGTGAGAVSGGVIPILPVLPAV